MFDRFIFKQGWSFADAYPADFRTLELLCCRAIAGVDCGVSRSLVICECVSSYSSMLTTINACRQCTVTTTSVQQCVYMKLTPCMCSMYGNQSSQVPKPVVPLT